MSADSSSERPRRPPGEAGAAPHRERPRPASDSPRLEAVVDTVAGIWGRLARVWRALSGERRLAALASIGLFATLFLPWYQETVIARGVTRLRSLSDTLTGWGAFSFVEAAVLLIAAGVLILLFVRAEGEAFHVPGGDGTVITAAGAWACVLIIWRMFDKEGTTGHSLYTTTSGIEWGIFVALVVAGLLTYAGTRIRLAHDPEPPLPGERPRRRLRGGRSSPRGPRSGDGPEARARAADSDWVAEDDIEETWLALERDRPAGLARRPAGDTSAPSPAAATSPLPPTAATSPLPPTAATAPLPSSPLPPTAATAPLPSAPDAAPAPRRRRPRSLADDPVTLPIDRPS